MLWISAVLKTSKYLTNQEQEVGASKAEEDHKVAVGK